MSLAARKSDLKNHLSRNTKKHLNASTSAPFSDAPIIYESGVAITAERAIAKIDLDERPFRADTDALEAITHRI